MKESFRVDELVVSDKDLDSSEIFFSGHNLYNLSVLWDLSSIKIDWNIMDRFKGCLVEDKDVYVVIYLTTWSDTRLKSINLRRAILNLAS